MRMSKYVKRLVYLSLAGFGGFHIATTVYPTVASQWKRKSMLKYTPEEIQKMNAPLPSREQLINAIQNEELDVLVIGGGATGLGVALDAVTRGLKTGLVERYDFASETSSRSTKLIHGGVRYLQKAIFNLDLSQYRLVKEAMADRGNMCFIAPHLAYPLPIMLPVYKWWQVPYYWAGIKMYDFVAGNQLLKSSYLLSKNKALELFPMLQKDKLKAAIVYYDGQQNDARMAISLAVTAVRHGAMCLNYTNVESLTKTCIDGEERLCGAQVRNMLTGEEYHIRAKCIINATGPYTDSIRTMSDDKVQKICQPSSGVHIILPKYYSPENMGLLDPATTDGRVIFFLPWQSVTVAGTTDTPCEVVEDPQPTEKDIQFILDEIRTYLSSDVEVRRGDILSAWSGIRPLVLDPKKTDTQSVARSHITEVSKNKLITIAGGKWTTYRTMAEDAVDEAIKTCNLHPSGPCRTKGLLLDGAHGWSPTLFIRLIQDFGMEDSVAQHLAQTYGDKAFTVAKLCKLTGKRWPVVGTRLHEEFPYIEAELGEHLGKDDYREVSMLGSSWQRQLAQAAEYADMDRVRAEIAEAVYKSTNLQIMMAVMKMSVKYAIKEYACRAVDIIARRTRLSFINVHAAQEALPRIIDVMACELGWDEDTKRQELDEAEDFICAEMGKSILEAYRCPTCPGLRDDYDPVIIPCGSSIKVPPDCTGPCPANSPKGISAETDLDPPDPCNPCLPPPVPDSDTCDEPRKIPTLPKNFCDGE